MTTWRNYANKGDGVHFPYGMPNKGEMKRIEMLGLMDDRRKRYLLQGSRAGLFRLAEEYYRKGMFATAEQVRAEARSCIL